MVPVVWVPWLPLSFRSAPWGNISLYPKNWLDAHSSRFLLELSRSIQIPVVGYRNRVHSKLFDLLKQSIHSIATIEEGIL